MTVTITVTGLTATVRVPDHRAARIVRRAVPPSGRESAGPDLWTVWASRVGAVTVALAAAGYDVRREVTS